MVEEGKVKKLIRENIRLEVTPGRLLYDDETEIMKLCQGIKKQIVRHIDDIDEVNIIWDEKEICEFCKGEWEVNERLDNNNTWDLGEPVCCQKAQKEWRELQ